MIDQLVIDLADLWPYSKRLEQASDLELNLVSYQGRGFISCACIRWGEPRDAHRKIALGHSLDSPACLVGEPEQEGANSLTSALRGP